MSTSAKPVIIVRKRKRAKHAHHGGSWKIAYADFMTAMMAFFLVMWLLSSSTPLQREQIADYFKMPLKLAMSHGDKSSVSDSPIPGGGDDLMKQDGEVLKQTLAKMDKQKNAQNLRRAHEKLENLIKKDPRLSDFQSNLRLSLTDDGLLIQIIDSQERPMFKVGSRELEPYMRIILQALVPVLNDLPNKINLTGHTDSLPYVNGEAGYSNWELSSDRANASRRTLVSGGLADNKFLRVIGSADMMNLANVKSDAPINRRISILVLSKNKEKSILEEDVVLQSVSDNQSSARIEAELKRMAADETVPIKAAPAATVPVIPAVPVTSLVPVISTVPTISAVPTISTQVKVEQDGHK
ncbi:flagellar motor protein MotB [Yersinia mollaretii]|uniref:flagellar motor protein MotB n=1 Tax=Yersinia mollaretii TaxID=33060 RepID=UPI000C1522C0|nr:flagellar motor protein MotB [Yersinia mollaretii]MDA5528379.1 flagellar motor protein MotB [Yersinia mollaretii]MDR7874346.1 flagellar motor protein MotB [Yersinia mollaretii]PHZ32475.1 motility protein MotB [Yersinia mollaretii]WQC74718.1 flagellar motor protein MotB [Yersinia mollaretii]